MTNVKVFIIGVVVGTLFGATFLGALSHLLVIGLAVVGAVTAALAVHRHRLQGGRAPKGLGRANAERASGDL
jgi:mannose/fructose/N-acetylgalactosamine-specific phosphotransferase system component IIC